MEQVNYKGYARSIGFDPIKAPYQALEMMAAHDNRVIRGMEDNRRAIKQVKDEHNRGLERKNEIESRDRDRNFEWEQKLRDSRQQAIRVKAETQIQSALTKGKNAKAVYENLAQFSSTVSKAVTEYKAKKDEENMLAGYMEVASGEFSPERQQQVENAETLLQASGAAQDKIAEGLQARGADPYVVSNLLSGNKARDYGRLKAYMEISMAEWPDYARAKLDEMGAVTASDRTQAMQGLFGSFLKERGLFGLKADFMAKGLIKMRGDYNALISEARQTDIVSKSELMRDESIENLFRSKSGDSLTDAFNTLARSYGPDGRTPLGRFKAKALLLEELSDTTRYSDDDVRRILGEAMTDQGTSWAERFGRDMDDLLNKRRIDAGREFNLNQQEEAQRQKEAEKELLSWVQESWNGDESSLQEIIKEANTKGIPTDRLKAHLAYSNEQKNADFWDDQFEEAYDQGLLTLEDVDQPGIPMTTRQKWRQLATEQEKQRASAGFNQDDVEKTFKSALQQNLIGDSTVRNPHYSLTPATNQALRRFNQKFKSYSKTMDPVAAAQKAQQEVLMEIEAGKSKNGRQGTGTFAVRPSELNQNGQAFFVGFTPGNHPGAPSLESSISLTGTLRQFRANPNIIDEKVLLSHAILRDIDNRIKAGKPISIPGLFSDLARVTGGSMSPVDILNRQLKAAGLQGQVQPGFRNNLSQINDPRLQAILQQPITQDRLNSVIIGGGHAPATIRTGDGGFQDVMAVTHAAGFAHPAVAAAMWALESGYGNYHTGRNNVFNIKASQGQGTMIPKREGDGRVYNSWWRDYSSPLESAKDFVQLMTDARYAGPLAAARTPRQAAQAIFSAGYATDPQYVNKVINVLKSQGINPDQPFNTNPNPARNSNYMRPTLAYVSGNIGPTSTGAHLDVKQQDNPNTSANEFAQNFAPNALDNFVVVNDPQLGRVPLSKIPITNSFADHQARGSHGIDYGLYSGTQVFVQNGARVVSKERTAHGDKVVIQLPDGRRFSFLHGTSV
jgi:hypothetical protein